MFAVIKNGNIKCFTLNKTFNDDYDEIIDFKDYDQNKNYIFKNGEIIEYIESQEENIILQELTIKETYQKMIFGKYSLTDQLNMSQEVQMISVIAQFEKRDLTDIEALRLVEIMEAKQWIDEQREKCKNEILELNT